MNIPFTVDQFLDVFQSYNLSVWPLQILFNLVAVLLVYFCFKKNKHSDKIILFSLSFFWLWIGIVYHLLFFSQINPAAYAFSAIYILQSVLFIIAAIKNQIDFKFEKSLFSLTGAVFILYALLVYPILGVAFGHTYPRNPTFGLPCPTTIFTFGILLFARNKIPVYLIGIPLIWSIVGFTAALKLGVAEDIGLLVAGLIGSMLIIFNKKSDKPQAVNRSLNKKL